MCVVSLTNYARLFLSCVPVEGKSRLQPECADQRLFIGFDHLGSSFFLLLKFKEIVKNIFQNMEVRKMKQLFFVLFLFSVLFSTSSLYAEEEKDCLVEGKVDLRFSDRVLRGTVGGRSFWAHSYDGGWTFGGKFYDRQFVLRTRKGPWGRIEGFHGRIWKTHILWTPQWRSSRRNGRIKVKYICIENIPFDDDDDDELYWED